jgi:hypothetical protein
LLYILFIIFIIGCGNEKKNSSVEEVFDDYYTTVNKVKIENDGKNIFIESVSVVGIDNYVLGTKSTNYDSIVTIASPYETTYVNCNLEKNETEYLLYSCDSFQYYCDDGMNCIQIYIDRNKDMYIDKQYPTFLYQQGTSQDKKYALGEFVYNGNLSYKSYDKLKILQ